MEYNNYRLINMEDIVAEEVEWLWEGFIPLGKLTILHGDPAKGKTMAMLNIIAALTTGRDLFSPPGSPQVREPVNVIYQTAEDGLADTIKPRLIAAGADCRRVFSIDDSDRALTMSDERIEKAIADTQAKLFVLDPFQAFLGARVDMHRANEVRPQMKRLSDIGARNRCAMVLIGHLNKNGKPCAYEDDFYIIFTSGTTGKPKGVRITANDLNNYLDWAVSIAGGIEEQSVFLNQAPYSFDLSVMDLYLSLATGGTVAAVDSDLQKDNAGLMEYLKTQKINYWVSTPSFADMCLADEHFDMTLLPEMKAFLFCGEVLSNRTALSLIRRFPKADVINTYGPTESTVCVTEILITEEMAAGSEPLPVGKVRPGTEIQIDPKTSEIIIIGNTVSPGYYRDEQLTRNFFIHSLGGGSDRHPEEGQGAVRAYRSGDKGHFDENGILYCDGRIDNQIKLHGYRIEIEDIEANLNGIHGINQAAVAPKAHEGKAESLTAFVVRDETVITDDYSGRKAVRMALREKMPSYMVPKRIVFLEELPVTNNGKLDRHRLREMA